MCDIFFVHLLYSFERMWGGSQSGRSNLISTYVTAECRTLQFCCSLEQLGSVLSVILLLKIFYLYVKVSLIKK